MTPRLWLNKAFEKNARGHYICKGDVGLERVRIEIDPSVLEGVPTEIEEATLVGMHSILQETARRMWVSGQAYPVEPGTARCYYSIAVTAEDLQSLQ